MNKSDILFHTVFFANFVSYISARYCLNSFSLFSHCYHKSHRGELFWKHSLHNRMLATIGDLYSVNKTIKNGITTTYVVGLLFY